MAPFLVCDAYSTSVTQPTEFEVFMDGATVPIISPAVSVTGGVGLNYDVGGVTNGNHNVTVKAVRVDSIWGRLTSAATSPFAFAKPSTPGVPSGLSLKT